MADFKPNEMPAATKPVTKRSGNAINGQMLRSVLSFTLAAQAIGDRLMLPPIPKGARGVRFRLQPSVALGAAATLALGIAGNVGKYRAAAIKNDTAAEDVSSAATTAAALTAEETPFLTVGGAALPGAGTLTVEMLYNV